MPCHSGALHAHRFLMLRQPERAAEGAEAIPSELPGVSTRPKLPLRGTSLSYRSRMISAIRIPLWLFWPSLATAATALSSDPLSLSGSSGRAEKLFQGLLRLPQLRHAAAVESALTAPSLALAPSGPACSCSKSLLTILSPSCALRLRLSLGS